MQTLTLHTSNMAGKHCICFSPLGANGTNHAPSAATSGFELVGAHTILKRSDVREKVTSFPEAFQHDLAKGLPRNVSIS